MKLKEGVVAASSDFWYDITYGGFIIPEDILEDESDIKRVKAAISTLRELEDLIDII